MQEKARFYGVLEQMTDKGIEELDTQTKVAKEAMSRALKWAGDVKSALRAEIQARIPRPQHSPVEEKAPSLLVQAANTAIQKLHKDAAVVMQVAKAADDAVQSLVLKVSTLLAQHKNVDTAITAAEKEAKEPAPTIVLGDPSKRIYGYSSPT